MEGEARISRERAQGGYLHGIVSGWRKLTCSRLTRSQHMGEGNARYSLESGLGQHCENELFGLPCEKVNFCRVAIQGWRGGLVRNSAKRRKQ